jgi:hypothetical protein
LRDFFGSGLSVPNHLSQKESDIDRWIGWVTRGDDKTTVLFLDIDGRLSMNANDVLLSMGQGDQAWCSDLCRKKISNIILEKYPCKQRFSRVDVIPLYGVDVQKHYRVTLWVNDWSTKSFGPVKEIWKTFYVTLEGIERMVVSIKEDRKKKLEIGERGLKFMDELRVI